ncbi:MAG: DUF2188 domain-containing protein [Gemmataceae bacterium]
MATEVLHVLPQGDGWAVKKEGNERPNSTHDTQKNAIDAARGLAKEGDEIVIHRQDGSIRDRTTYAGANGTEERTDRPQAYDIWSVGTRVRWSAIAAGVVVALSISALLMALASALGVTIMDQMRARTVTVVAGTIWFIIMFVSLLLGGYVATRATTRETQFEAVIIGVLVWGTTFALALLGLGTGAGVALDASRTASVLAADKPFWRDLNWNADQTKRYEAMTNPSSEQVRKELNLTEDEARRYDEAQRQARDWSREHPKTMAWCAFFGMAVSLAAAIAGALLGAGPEVTRRDLRRDTGAGAPNAATREMATA